MLIAGANRHAKEVLELLHNQEKLNEIVFFDDVSKNSNSLVYQKYPIIKTLSEAEEYFKSTYVKFVLALGNPADRKKVSDKLEAIGGKLSSIIARSAFIGHYDVHLECGLNVMHNAMISNSVRIGKGTLLNAYSSVHHDVVVGQYCELSPHAVLLGGCTIGNFTAIGANATVLPDVSVGNNVVVGAGAVVTKNIPDNSVAVGIPARVVKFNNS